MKRQRASRPSRRARCRLRSVFLIVGPSGISFDTLSSWEPPTEAARPLPLRAQSRDPEEDGRFVLAAAPRAQHSPQRSRCPIIHGTGVRRVRPSPLAAEAQLSSSGRTNGWTPGTSPSSSMLPGRPTRTSPPYTQPATKREPTSC